jgi:hypothetical protein
MIDLDAHPATEAPERTFARDPVVMAALDAHGLSNDRLPWEQGEGTTLEVVQIVAGDLVHITLTSDAEASLRWYRPRPDHSVSYELDAQGARIVLEDLRLPETAVAGLEGRRVAEIVDLPGCEAAVITRAELRTSPNMTDVVIHIRHGDAR